MASTLIGTTSFNPPLLSAVHSRVITPGGRYYVMYLQGSNDLVLRYSDNGGATWSSAISVAAINGWGKLVAYNDGTQDHLEIFYAGGNGSATGLFHRAIRSNVSSGTPGSLTTEITIQLASAGVNGVSWLSAWVSNTGTRPRIWVTGQFWDTATNRSQKLWYAGTGSGADTLGNWTAIADIGSNLDANSNKFAKGCFVTIGGNPRCVIVMTSGGSATPNFFKSAVFDPTVLTPSVGTLNTPIMTLPSTNDFDDMDAAMPMFDLVGKNDYLVCARGRGASIGTWDIFSSTDGATWTSRGNVPASHLALTKHGSDFSAVYVNGNIFDYTVVNDIQKVDYIAASNTVGTAQTISDRQGPYPNIPDDTGATALALSYPSGLTNFYSDSIPYLTEAISTPMAASFTVSASARVSSGRGTAHVIASVVFGAALSQDIEDTSTVITTFTMTAVGRATAAPPAENFSFADRLYEELAPLAYDDINRQMALQQFCRALGTMFQPIEDVSRDRENAPGWSQVMNADTIISEGLPWLGQFVGVTLLGGLDDFNQRLRIKTTSGMQRGSPDAIRGAAAQYLIGKRQVIMRERFGGPYNLAVITYSAETPDPSSVLTALMEQKPAGIILTYAVHAGQDYQQLKDNSTTYANLKLQYSTYNGMRNFVPGS